MPSDINRLAVPALAKGLRVVVKLVIADEALSSKKSPSWPCHGAHAFKTFYW
jgi:hypothetical protein